MKIVNESKSFSNKIILKQISFNFNKGIYKIEGKNGSGKTTLLRLLSGLDRFDSGNCMQLKGDILYLDTNFIGVTPLTIEDNLKLLWKTFDIHPNSQVLHTINLFFGGRLQDNYSTASVGTKAKLGLSLCFVKDWDYVFIDETLSTIDRESLDMLVERLLVMESIATIFYVSHNLVNTHLLEKSQVIHLEREENSIEKK